MVIHDSLNFGHCHLSLGVPNAGKWEQIQTLDDLKRMPEFTPENPLRVVTGYQHVRAVPFSILTPHLFNSIPATGHPSDYSGTLERLDGRCPCHCPPAQSLWTMRCALPPIVRTARGDRGVQRHGHGFKPPRISLKGLKGRARRFGGAC